MWVTPRGITNQRWTRRSSLTTGHRHPTALNSKALDLASISAPPTRLPPRRTLPIRISRQYCAVTRTPPSPLRRQRRVHDLELVAEHIVRVVAPPRGSRSGRAVTVAGRRARPSRIFACARAARRPALPTIVTAPLGHVVVCSRSPAGGIGAVAVARG